MEITRTANAGVLLKLSGVSFLLDGVSKHLFPYEKTPESIKSEIMKNPPDVMAFTHFHPDHYDEDFVNSYKEDTLRSVNGPELSDFLEEGKTRLYAVSTRHIGKSDIPHVSFVISGEKCVWFMGDASPLTLRKLENMPKPDVLIAPFAYFNTASSFEAAKRTGAKNFVVVHMPEKENDEYNLWRDVKNVIGEEKGVFLMKTGEKIIL